MKRKLQPYLIITVAGLLAFAPVSFMAAALKNDIVALEFPINYFISQCIHNGEIPYWFNTWGMGFPLQSNLTWGIYSTPQLLFCTIFNYNIYVLHLEFMFFILLSGWSMFYLLKRYLVKDEMLSLVLSVCYMLSGFMVGSSQWLLYITAAAFVPLVISSLLQLLYAPSLRHSLWFAVMYYLMFTSVYAAFNIITSYSLVIFIVIYFLREKQTKQERKKLIIYSGFAGLFTFLLCFPCVYYLLELLKYIDRGSSIAGTEFFNSNYVHPAGLGNMLLPFSSVKVNFANTEGTMSHSYMGLFTLLFLPLAIWKTIKEKNRTAMILLTTAILFLFFSFGAITPLRNALNILPGFSYFRNPGIFRFYFILSLILCIAIVFRNVSWKELISFSGQNRVVKFTLLLLAAICLIVLLTNGKALKGLSFTSPGELVKNLSFQQAILISAVIQLVLLGVLLLLIIKQRFRLAGILFIADVVINTLICTPYFSVSSYSLSEINTILASEKGFPVQREKISEVPATFTDSRMNTWYNVNVFQKKVSSNESYRGPVTLKQYSDYFADTAPAAATLFDYPLVFTNVVDGKLTTILQRPTHIRVTVDIPIEAKVIAMQNYYPGWKAYYNDTPLEFIDKDMPGLTVVVPKGSGTIDFKYEKKAVWISAFIIHFIIIGLFASYVYLLIRRRFA